jgi:hypothetical protein
MVQTIFTLRIDNSFFGTPWSNLELGSRRTYLQ